MSTSYLQKTVSARLDANGNGTAVLRPDVGQYWAPSLVQVSTAITPANTAGGGSVSAANSALCTLYRGSVGPLNAANYVDDTFNGSGDSSSIVAGTIVMYGEAITAVWADGTPLDTAIMTVYGRSSDNLIELQEVLSPIPGTRFAGNAGSFMVWNYNDFTDNGPGALPTVPPRFTTPFNLNCELVSAKFTVTTSAAVGNRFLGLTATIFDGTTNVRLFNVWEGDPQPASVTATYNFAVGVNNYDIGVSPNVFVGTALPDKMILPPGSILEGSRNGILAGDTWTNFQVIYRQYRTLTTLGLT